MNKLNERLLSALEEDLPLIEEPFAPMAEEAGMTQEELFCQIRRLLNEGTIRRFGAILSPHRAGIKVNALVVWQVAEEKVAKVGESIAKIPEVSHCYQRPPFPNFPYNLYSMIHTKSEAELQAIIHQIVKSTGIEEYCLLRTTKEYKKTSPSYALTE